MSTVEQTDEVTRMRFMRLYEAKREQFKAHILALVKIEDTDTAFDAYAYEYEELKTSIYHRGRQAGLTTEEISLELKLLQTRTRQEERKNRPFSAFGARPKRKGHV